MTTNTQIMTGVTSTASSSGLWAPSSRLCFVYLLENRRGHPGPGQTPPPPASPSPMGPTDSLFHVSAPSPVPPEGHGAHSHEEDDDHVVVQHRLAGRVERHPHSVAKPLSGKWCSAGHGAVSGTHTQLPHAPRCPFHPQPLPTLKMSSESLWLSRATGMPISSYCDLLPPGGTCRTSGNHTAPPPPFHTMLWFAEGQRGQGLGPPCTPRSVM